MHKKNRKKPAPNGITFGMISVIFISITIVLILTMIKIYLSNEIYYESKIVNKMTRENSILKAEQTMLQESVEEVKFRNRVADTIFTI